jgi:hypothetical protein
MRARGAAGTKARPKSGITGTRGVAAKRKHRYTSAFPNNVGSNNHPRRREVLRASGTASSSNAKRRAGVDQSDGVFGHFVNSVAFIDRAEFGLRGKMREIFLSFVLLLANLAIGGPKRRYARSIHGRCLVSGNAMEFRYGPSKSFQRLAPFYLIVRSVQLPVTAAQMFLVARNFLCLGFRAEPSRLELTFDVNRFSVTGIADWVYSRARQSLPFRDRFGRETFYVGSPKSPWELRVYQKADSVVRIEWIFRRAFFRAHFVKTPELVLFLRNFDLGRTVRFLELDIRRCKTLMLARVDKWKRRTMLLLLREMSLREQLTFLRKRFGARLQDVARPAPLEQLLSRMQSNLVW